MLPIQLRLGLPSGLFQLSEMEKFKGGYGHPEGVEQLPHSP
jgi:hypothetical protein